MEVKVQSMTFGEISMTENIWTGKRQVFINGTELIPVAKNSFQYQTENGVVSVTLKGNAFTGCKMMIGNEMIVMYNAPAWYEIALSVFIPVFVIIWGAVPSLVKIFPIVGGAIGGAISAVFGVVNLVMMKKTGNIGLKLLIFVGVFAATLVICWLLALAFLKGTGAI